MAKLDVVQAAKDAMAAAQDSALGGCYDAAFAEGVASVPAASDDVAAAVAAQAAKDAADMAAAVAAVQAELDAMSAKDGADVAQVAALQAKLDQIKALLA